MKIDCLIIGQGISGTFLSHELGKAGISFLVIDALNPQSASRIASGIINPVTGRRIVKTWMIDELMPVAYQAYKDLEDILNIHCITQLNNIDFFPTPQMRLAFLDRLKDDAQYLRLPEDENDWHSTLSYDFGYGVIDPCYLVNLQELLPSFRRSLLDNNKLIEEHFDLDKLLITTGGIQYQDIIASKIIFCDGIASQQGPWFKNLPFAPNKGEVLIAEIDNLPPANIYKKGLSIVPWKENLFWVGSSHEWKFDDAGPTVLFKQKTEAQLKGFCKTSFKIMDHWAAIRPATLERRPFIGFHPQFLQLGIFNGMGTKGCSLAPYFAKQMVDQIAGKAELLPEVNIERFKKVLSRNNL